VGGVDVTSWNLRKEISESIAWNYVLALVGSASVSTKAQDCPLLARAFFFLIDVQSTLFRICFDQETIMGTSILRAGEELAGAIRGEGAAVRKEADAAIRGVDVEPAGEIRAAGSEEEAQAIQEAAQEGAQEAEQAAAAARGVEAEGAAVDRELGAMPEVVDKLANVKKFAKFVAVETAKGVLMAAGMEAVEQVVKAIERRISDSDKEAAKNEKQAKVDKIAAIVTQWKLLRDYKDEWQKWMLARFSLKSTYGQTTSQMPGPNNTILPVMIANYDVVETQVSLLSAYITDTVSKAADATQKSTTESLDKNIAVLLFVCIRYAGMTSNVADIITGQNKMIQAGLHDHKSDITAVSTKLTALQTEEDRKNASLAEFAT
jgi:hypothetical protein